MLTLSTKGRYATRIMIYLAMSRTREPVRKHDVARAESISSDYVEQILIKLKTAGLVESRRGVAGGFMLARPPSAITVNDVLEAVEGPISLVSCLKETCQRSSACVTRQVWEAATQELRSFFSKVRIDELARQSQALADQEVVTFHI